MTQMTLTGSDELELFYKNKFYFSYSSINKLLFSPRMFYSHYVLNQRQDSVDAHLIEGRVLHCLLLEPENFDEQFLVINSKVPSGNTKTIIDAIFKQDKCRVTWPGIQKQINFNTLLQNGRLN